MQQRETRRIEWIGTMAAAAMAAGCGSSSNNDPPDPVFDQTSFGAGSATVTNALFPLVVDSAALFRTLTPDGVETIVVEVLDETRVVDGVECAVVRDRVYEDDLLVEDTRDWFAQDAAGNVWYLGEEVTNYEYDDEGNLLGTDSDGAWESGQDVAGIGQTATAGIQMKAAPIVGDTYFQEFYPGQAEDKAAVLALAVPVTLADGTSFTCLHTRETTALEPGAMDDKYFADGVGLVLELEPVPGGTRAERLGTFDLSLGSLPPVGLASFGDPTSITNPYLPHEADLVRGYAVATEDGAEVTIVELGDETRFVDGVECAVVRDRVFLDELLIEDTDDWFAQDDQGNVWYFGEEVVDYEYDDDGMLIGTASSGSWEAGVDGAQAGILHWSSPTIGEPYRQEYYEDEAEDMGVLVATDVEVETEDGTVYGGCRQVLEWTPLEPESVEYKFHAPGVGVVAEDGVDGEDRLELLGVFDLGPNSLPDFASASFTNPTGVTNAYFPLVPGSSKQYVTVGDEDEETVQIDVLFTTRMVAGVECVEVRDQVFAEGLLLEDTVDWFAQDDDGNVWYFGEDVTNYEYDDVGMLIGTDSGGSWEAGVDGAEPGIQQWASPSLGTSYFQEFYADEAEDMAVVVSLDASVTLSDGTTFSPCLQTLEWTPLEPGAFEHKFYFAGEGLVLEQKVATDERLELSPGP